jgi:hypothetical protein
MVYKEITMLRNGKKLRNEELYDLYNTLNIIRVIKSKRIRVAGNVARMRERRVSYKVLVRETEESRPVKTPSRKWEGNIKTNLQKAARGAWIGSTWLRIGTGGELL